MDDLIGFLRARYAEEQQIAREASRSRDRYVEGGEHWHWVESETDQPVPPDPLTEEFVGENADQVTRVALRSVEEYPTGMTYTLPHMVVPYAEEVPAVCGLHIALWDPARVLAELAAKERILRLHQCGGINDSEGIPPAQRAYCATCGSGEPFEYPVPWPCETLLALARPYAEHPDYRDEWKV